MRYGIDVEVVTQRGRDDGREHSIDGGNTAIRYEPKANGDTSSVGVHWEYGSPQAVHHDALGGLQAYARERPQIRLCTLIVVARNFVQTDFTEVLEEAGCNLLQPSGALARQTRVPNERSEVPDRYFRQHRPVSDRVLHAIEDAFVARRRRHLRKDDEDQLVERVLLCCSESASRSARPGSRRSP